ncbi:hypothetical protein B566_EDAN005610 [Ephemera danica]|nr:hypothetical protein B566_EDAN005610 [Ephemera danica]
MQRTPSTSAIYERLRAGRGLAASDLLAAGHRPRFTFSAENLNLLDRSRDVTAAAHDPRSARLLDINPAEFLKYKMEKSSLAPSPALGASTSSSSGSSGLLWVHLLAGRGLKATPTPGARGALAQCRDLYCVLECDRVHKARTVVRTGELVFEWDETFELDLVDNRQLDLLIYSWDPHFRHKLCYKGSLHISALLRESPVHQLALRIEPRGTLYLKLRHTPPRIAFRRSGGSGIPSHTMFGADLEAVVARESGMAAVTGAGGTPSASVPVLVRRCVEEVERRGLDIIGLYRLCGSATKKRILREAFERNPRTVDLSPDNVPDINVITGVLKDYLRELPEPLFTKCLYQMLLDALSVCLPDDPEGNAKLMFSILDCLPKVNRIHHKVLCQFYVYVDLPHGPSGSGGIASRSQQDGPPESGCVLWSSADAAERRERYSGLPAANQRAQISARDLAHQVRYSGAVRRACPNQKAAASMPSHMIEPARPTDDAASWRRRFHQRSFHNDKIL